MARARKAIVGALMESAVLICAQQVSACDLAPVTRSFSGKLPIGSLSIDTDTKVTITFTPDDSGKINISRNADTFLLLIGETIANQFGQINSTLPKNDCNQYADLSSNSRVTPPTFTIKAKATGSLWVCTPSFKVPCPSFPMIDIHKDIIPTSQDDKGADAKLINVQFKLPNLPLPKLPNAPHLPNIPLPNIPLPNLPIKQCDGLPFEDKARRR